MINGKLAYSIAEVTDLTDISRSSLYVLWGEGRGPRYMKLGRRRLVRHADLVAWLQTLADATYVRAKLESAPIISENTGGCADEKATAGRPRHRVRLLPRSERAS